MRYVVTKYKAPVKTKEIFPISGNRL